MCNPISPLHNSADGWLYDDSQMSDTLHEYSYHLQHLLEESGLGDHRCLDQHRVHTVELVHRRVKVSEYTVQSIVNSAPEVLVFQ